MRKIMFVCGVLFACMCVANSQDISNSTIKIISSRPCNTSDIPASVQRIEYESSVDGAKDWALISPPSRGNTWVVNLHGYGSQGDQIYVAKDIRKAWLPKFEEQGYGILAPNLREGAFMSPAAASDLHALLEFVRKEFKAKRFVFFGGSMGGIGNLIYGVLYPEDVAAMVAFCPASDISSFYAYCRGQTNWLAGIADSIEKAYSGTPSTLPEVYKKHSALENTKQLTMPVFVAHGTCDEAVPVSQSRALAEKMKGTATFTYFEIPGGDHGAPLFSGRAMRWFVSTVQALDKAASGSQAEPVAAGKKTATAAKKEASPSAQKGEELLKNGGFENIDEVKTMPDGWQSGNTLALWPAGWGPYSQGKLTVVTNDVHGGRYAVKCEGGVLTSSGFPVSAGDQLHVSFWAKGDAGISISFYGYSTSGQEQSDHRYFYQALPLTQEWKEYEIDFDANEKVGSGCIWFWVRKDKGITLFLDDVAVSRIEPK